MPVTAKLSRRFYDQLGDDVANELVNWFNAVDDTYRNQLRELNELNWERFRAELRAEGAAIRAEMDKRFAVLGTEMDKRFTEMDKRFTEMDKRFTDVDKRFTDVDKRFTEVDKRFTQVDKWFTEIETRFSAIDAGLGSLNDGFPAFEAQIEAKFDAKFAKLETRMYKVMFGFWTATVIPLAALILALDGAFQR